MLDPQPIAGVPQVRTDGNGGLMDVALHPRFADNHLVYLTYTKPVGNGKGAPSLARGRLDGGALTDVRDLIVPEAFDGNSGLNGRVVFGRDGMVYMSTGGNIGKIAQDPAACAARSCACRTTAPCRGTIRSSGRAGYRPEIYTLGHRNTLGLIVHPETGAIWNHENGPNGGDKINIIVPGRNYGWPIVSFGRDYPDRASPIIRRRKAWSRRWSSWLPRLRSPAWRCTPATVSRRGRATSSSAHARG